MESITVGFDGSEPSFVALDWVAERAGRAPCKVEIVTVNAPELFADDATVEAALRDAELRVRNRAPTASVSFRTVSGTMPDELLSAAEHADLLVIGAHRRRPIRSALTGWLPVRTASRSRVPTVVVPADWTGGVGPVLVGIDDNESSHAAVEFAAAEARTRRAELTLLHAWQMPIADPNPALAPLATPAEVESNHRGILEQVFEQTRDACPDLKIDKVLAHNGAVSSLMALAPRSSLLVLGAHQRGALSGALLGSVAQDAIRETPVPTCIVPPDGDT